MRTTLFLIVLAGCTHHRDIKEAYELDGDEVEVSGQYGQSVTAVGTKTPGGIVFVDKASGGVVPYDEIHKIEDTSHALGALQGLAIGGGIGAIGGGLLGYLDGDDECDPDSHAGCSLSFSAGGKAILLGAVLGVIGGAAGLVVGGIQGATTIYERPGTQTTVRAVGPSGSVAGVTVEF